MKVQLLRSITSIQRALPEGSKLNSTKRNEIYNSLESYESNFRVEVTDLEHTCAISELGNFDVFSTTEDVQITVLRSLITEEALDTTTSPISLEFPYGLIFTIIDDENGRNTRDAILGILPFKLIGKGVSTKTSNSLETWGLFPEPTV